MKPSTKPNSPNFSSGPCKKRPGYELNNLDLSTLGRSHRSALGKGALKQAIDETRELLEIPAEYRVGIVPASDTGAFEMAMWTMLGQRPVTALSWESFGLGWAKDLTDQLTDVELREHRHADYGQLPSLDDISSDDDLVFAWNGTTSGVKLSHADWINAEREGLTFCDATSAVFAMSMPWSKLDVTTYSWQKVLGGEGGHGVLILSPRAVERLQTFVPPRPLPKIFRLTKKGQLIEGIFSGSTINTPSMLCVADYLDALNWVRKVGGLQGTIARSEANFTAISQFVAANDWLDFLAVVPSSRSNTSVCLTLDLPPSAVKSMVSLLAEHEVAYDIGAYRDAPPGLRIWCGATVETADIEALLPWLAWAYKEVRQ